MEEIFEKKYHELEENHFWFKARRKYILQILKSSPRDSKILDIGCSSGVLLNDLIEIGFKKENLYGIDISEKAIYNCKQNGIKNSFVMDAQEINLPEKFDIIIASDCLEHIQNDEKAISNWYSILKKNGVALIFVPAFMFLWSNHDEANMHFRRYSKRQLTEVLNKSAFEINKSSYWNFFLFFPIILVRIYTNLSKSKKTNGNLNTPPAFNNLFFNLLRFENKILNYINFPIGVSTYCIVTKKN